jgi:hypothetical protein
MLAVFKTVVDKRNMNDPSIEPGLFSVFFSMAQQPYFAEVSSLLKFLEIALG